MKKVLFIIMLSLMFGQSRATITSKPINMTNPCEDKIYIQLKDKKLDEMSDREYEYFSQMSKDCSAYQTAERTTKPKDEIVKQQKEYWDTYITISIVSILVSLIFTL